MAGLQASYNYNNTTDMYMYTKKLQLFENTFVLEDLIWPVWKHINSTSKEFLFKLVISLSAGEA